MNNQLVYRYFKQYQELFGNTVYTKKKTKTSFNVSGAIDSNFVFIKDYSTNKNEIDIFNKIIKALNMLPEKILVIDCLGTNYKKDDSLISFIQKLSLKDIIIFGEEISQYILKTDKDIQEMRKNNNIFNNTNIIPTYSIKDIIVNIDLKKRVWNDIKVIR